MRTGRRGPLVVAAVGLVLAVAAGGQTLSPLTSGLIPVVAHLDGANASAWRTDVFVRQTTGSSPAEVHFMALNPSGDSWETSVVLPDTKATAALADVLGAMNGVPDGKYILRWWSTQPVVVTSRTYTASGPGTVGQGTASVAPGTGFGEGGEVILPAPMDSGTHRVNVGLSNAGANPQTFAVEALDAMGTVVDSWTRTVVPGAIDQFRSNPTGTGAGSVEIRCTAGCDGNAFAYMSVVTSDTNDAYFVYAGAQGGAQPVVPVATTRDAKGVWYITGGTLFDVFEAMGYAEASDRLWQMELYRRSARGTMAEVFGSTYVNNDVLVRTTGYSAAELTSAFASLDDESKTVITAFVAGINRRLGELRADASIVPFEFKALSAQLGQTFLPADWTPSDVLAWSSLLLRNFDPEAQDTGQLQTATLLQHLQAAFPTTALAMFSDLRWRNDPSAPTMIPPEASAPVTAAAPHVPDLRLLPDLGGAATRLRQRYDDARTRLQELGAFVKMGSYAWVVSGTKTASGRPILYSGPQMGFSAPAIVTEGSIRGGGLAVSGMTVPGVPGLIIGRTPHHAWSMQVGEAHTTDYYLEPPQAVTLDRVETINVAGAAPMTLPVYHTSHGPIVEPIPYDPANPPAVIVSWKYAQRGYELTNTVDFALGVARAQSMDAFGAAVAKVAVSQHFCYADKDGNIAYWMSGFDPVRPAGVDARLPLLGDGSQEWPQPVTLKRRATARNPQQGFFGGWNNKAAIWYDDPPNALGYSLGPAHRAQVVINYLSTHDDLTYEQVRDLAINIASTDSLGGGGDTWAYVKDFFRAAVQASPSTEHDAALLLMDAYDGHFVAGGPTAWVTATTRDDAWVLQNAWIREMIRLTFSDELTAAGMTLDSQPRALLFNVLLRALQGDSAALPTHYDWFGDASASGLPTTADGLIVLALDNTLASLGAQPWNVARGDITYKHALLGTVSTTPFASRSTYAHCVEYGADGPERIESMFPLGESGTILMDASGNPVFDPNFFSMKPVYDAFAPRPFPLFE